MTTERYNEIVAKLNEFCVKYGRGIQCWWFQEIDWTKGLINNGDGPYPDDDEQQVIQADITQFLAESGCTAREMWDWGYEAAEEAGRRAEEAMRKSDAEYERKLWEDAFGGGDEVENLDPYPCDGMGY